MSWVNQRVHTGKRILWLYEGPLFPRWLAMAVGRLLVNLGYNVWVVPRLRP